MTITGRSTSQPEYTTQKNHLLHSSLVDGLAYSWSHTYNASDDHTILLVKNTSTTHNLVIDQIWCHCDTTTTVKVHHSEVATPAGTAITAVWMKTGGSAPDAVAKGNDTGQSGGLNVWQGSIAADSSTPILVNSGLVLTEGFAVGVDYATGGSVEATVTIIGHYEKT